MSKELKVGIFAIIIILVSIWGYSFIKGQNMLSSNTTLYAEFEDLDRLAVSSPVLIRGIQVGTVTDIFLSPENNRSAVVEISIEKKYPVPKSALVLLRNGSLVGGKIISLEYDLPCSNNCAQNGDYLKGISQGIINSLVGEDNLTELSTKLKETIGGVMKSDSAGETNVVQNLGEIMESLAIITESLEQNWGSISYNLNATMTNLNEVTSAFAKNEDALQHSLQNLDSFTTKLSRLDLNQTVDAANNSLASINDLSGEFTKTLEKTQKSVENLESILQKMNSDKGTLGKMINDEELYVNLNRSSNELNLLLQDFRLNPKRYVNVSVFGKKQKSYKVPEDDPAYEEE